MNIQTKIVLLGLLLGCFGVAGWSQGVKPGAIWESGFRQSFPSGLRTTEHEDTPNSCLNLEWRVTGAFWDSTAWDRYQYYPNGDRSQMIVSLYNLGTWEDWSKVNYTYDQAGHVVSYLGMEWSGVAWDSVEKYLLEWDTQGNLTLQMHYTRNGSAWDSTSGDRYTYTYHNGNLISEQIREYYSSGSHSWRLDERWVYHYNLQDERDTLTFYYDDNGAWMPYERFVDVLYYDFPRDLYASFRFQEFNGVWDDALRYHYSYGQYDGYELDVESFAGTWDSSYKEVVTKDAKGHTVSDEQFLYNNGWVMDDGDISHFTYDGLGRTAEEWTEYYDGSNYVKGSKRIYDSFFVVGAAGPQAVVTGLETWPNPCSGTLHLQPRFGRAQSAVLSLYDLQGGMRWQSELWLHSAAVTIDLPETLPDGSYLLQVNSAEGKSVERVVLVR